MNRRQRVEDGGEPRARRRPLSGATEVVLVSNRRDGFGTIHKQGPVRKITGYKVRPEKACRDTYEFSDSKTQHLCTYGGRLWASRHTQWANKFQQDRHNDWQSQGINVSTVHVACSPRASVPQRQLSASPPQNLALAECSAWCGTAWGSYSPHIIDLRICSPPINDLKDIQHTQPIDTSRTLRGSIIDLVPTWWTSTRPTDNRRLLILPEPYKRPTGIFNLVPTWWTSTRPTDNRRLLILPEPYKRPTGIFSLVPKWWTSTRPTDNRRLICCQSGRPTRILLIIFNLLPISKTNGNKNRERCGMLLTVILLSTHPMLPTLTVILFHPMKLHTLASEDSIVDFLD
ncbi:hypothetical protein J6590_057370 [Homalodisca vitripennis]|nr:hypothetical protein J6590_057370 [Homalodisca vitripennis]